MSFFKRFLFLILTATMLDACATSQQAATSANTTAYNYPVNNPYAATIVGTPPELRQPYTNVPDITEKQLVVFKDRKVPEGFWYNSKLKYGELLQDHAAPVIYVIAGTGADYHSDSMRTLGAAFYTAGYHVILLPSTTQPDFIVSASQNFIPGRPLESAKDLYRVIRMIDNKLAGKVTAHYLTGYSLGAMDAAFTAALDDQQKIINFQKVLLINPPYNLYSSIQQIDKMLYVGLPGGMNGVDQFIDTEMARIATISPSGDALDFQNARALIEAYTKYPAGDQRLATMIGLAFRLFAANMIFTSDVMAHTGYIFPPNAEFTTGTSLNNYLTVALRTSLMNYFEDVYMPYYLKHTPGLTKEQLIAESSLSSVSGFLSTSPKVGLMTNRDDIILAPGELEKLSVMFGNRATIYPNGGHLGNLTYPPVLNNVVAFFKGGQQ